MSAQRKGLPLEAVQSFNRRVILGAIQDLGPCSRKEISVRTSLDQATVKRAIAPLIDDGVVEEEGLVKGGRGRGRRSINLNFSRGTHGILCLPLQRRGISLASFNLRGEVQEEVEIAIVKGQSPSRTFAKVSRRLEKLTGLAEVVDGIAVALPGPFLERDERVILMTESPEWQAFDLVQALRTRYPKIPVYSIHDAKAAALTVWRERAKRMDSKVMLYVSAGQGIGSALVVGGDVFRGSQGTAGELGHTSIEANGPRCKCGNHGCLELFSSRIVLLREIREYAAGNAATVLSAEASFADVVDAYHEGDSLAVAEVERVARYLAQGITNCINFVNPDLIILGDEYAAFGARFLAAIGKYVKASVLPSIFENLRLELADIDGDLVLKLLGVRRSLSSTSLRLHWGRTRPRKWSASLARCAASATPLLF